VSRLTFEAMPDRAPRWSADGESVWFESNRGEGAHGIWSVRADGTGTPELIQPLERETANFDRSPDERWVVYGTAPEPSRDIYAVEIGSGVEVPLAANPNFSETAPSISPDGKWIAYVSDETGRPQVYVRPFPDFQSGRWQVSDGAGVAPVWSESGDQIFYSTTSQMFAARIEAGSSIRVLGHEPLFNIPPGVTAQNARGWYDVSNDGERFLMARPRQFGSDGSEDPIQLVLVQNFFEELKARVPNQE
jgi:serine/threonine-protein kinase